MRYKLTPEQIAEIRRIRRRLRAGKTRLANEHEVAALKRKLRLA
jgi:hypothetical protein